MGIDYSNATTKQLSELAEQGDVMAQKFLAYRYDIGQGVKKDYERAIYWFEKAAEQGNRIAQKNLDIVSKQIETEKGLKRCAHCGGTFKGIFKKVCSVCGKEKDY